MTKFVYRLECVETGEGPYRGEASYRLRNVFKTYRHNDSFHPLPMEDEKLRQVILEEHIDDISDYVFGFATMKQARRWFSKGETKRLENTTYRICKYKMLDTTVKAVIDGTHQLIFKKDYAIKIPNFDRL